MVIGKNKKNLNIGLISDHPNIVFEDVCKSLSGKFNLKKINASDEKYSECDIYIFASNRYEKFLITGIAHKIDNNRDLLVVSSEHDDLEVDIASRTFFYPYKYDIIVNLPLVVKTVYSASQVSA